MIHRLLLTALFVFACTAPAFAQRPLDGWGPSWVSGSPPGGSNRPKDLKENSTKISLSGSGFAVEVRVWGDVSGVQKGHEYSLIYQLRVHTAKGEMGPMIGVEGAKSGTPFLLTTALCGDDWWGLEGVSDITRKELTGMFGFPEVKGFGLETVFLRVEPQLFDVTDQKYLTEMKSPEAILVATVGEGRKVISLTPLAKWVADNAKSNSGKVVELLASLDVMDHAACNIVNAMLETLEDEETKKEVKVKLVEALPSGAVMDSKTNYHFFQLMEEWGKGDDADLKAAAKKVLGEK